MSKHLSSADWQELAATTDREINRVIRTILDSAPDDEQKTVDFLRAIHQVIGYHMGTIEGMIIRGFGESATDDIIRKIVDERDEFIKKGYQHAAFHDSGTELEQ